MVQSTRAMNRGTVLAEVFRTAPTSRKNIAAATGISTATVTRAIDALIAEGILREGSEIVSENRGRRAVLLHVVAAKSYVVGVDLGASNTRIIVADLLATPVVALEMPTPSDLDAVDLANWLAMQVRQAAGTGWRLVAAICLGLPGAVNRLDRSVSNAPHLPQVEDGRFLATLETAVGMSVTIDNDANLALLGEQRFGAAKNSPTAAMLTLGTGLGAGLAIDGKVLQGDRGLIGEFGQLPVGPLGTKLEHMLTGPGILRRAAEAGVTLSVPAELFTGKDGGGKESLRSHFDHALVIALTAITVSCEPKTIVLGGGIAKSLTSSLERYHASLLSNLRMAPQLLPASLGDYSGAVGAVVAALHTVYRGLGISERHLAGLPVSQTLTPDSISAAALHPVLRDVGT
jgi:predicted NBD/HSP70 family sugar kinase/biotin operon repressor